MDANRVSTAIFRELACCAEDLASVPHSVCALTKSSRQGVLPGESGCMQQFGGDLKPDSREPPEFKDNAQHQLIDMKMYVGNLPFQTGNEELEELFSNYGTVTDIHLPMDRDSGRPRGFAFVTMSSKDEMVAAIKGLDGQELGGRPLRVNEAEERRGGGGGGYGGGGGKDRRGGGGGYGGKERRGGGGGGRW